MSLKVETMGKRFHWVLRDDKTRTVLATEPRTHLTERLAKRHLVKATRQLSRDLLTQRWLPLVLLSQAADFLTLPVPLFLP